MATTARKTPQDHKPKASTVKTDTLPGFPIALQDKFTLNGDVLSFDSKRGMTIDFNLEVDLGTLDLLLGIDMSSMDADGIKDSIELLAASGGEDARRIPISEFGPVFARWGWEVGIFMSESMATLPESVGSTTE